MSLHRYLTGTLAFLSIHSGTMGIVIIAALGTLLTGTFAGWLGHWALHQRWAGRFYRAHLTHHRLYPPNNLRSTKYREAKKDNTTFFLGPTVGFVAIAWLLLLVWFEVGLAAYGAVVVLGVVVGYLHEYLHEAFHLKAHWLDRFGWFRSLRSLHFEHHRKLSKNIGIMWFGWDRLFRTFKKP